MTRQGVDPNDRRAIQTEKGNSMKTAIELYNIVLLKGSKKSTINKNVAGKTKANKKLVFWKNYFADKDGATVEIERAEVLQ